MRSQSVERAFCSIRFESWGFQKCLSPPLPPHHCLKAIIAAGCIGTFCISGPVPLDVTQHFWGFPSQAQYSIGYKHDKKMVVESFPQET